MLSGEGNQIVKYNNGSNCMQHAFLYISLTPGGALGYFLGGYVPPRTPNWHPVLEKISPKIDTLF